jgi:hypothetical protein
MKKFVMFAAIAAGSLAVAACGEKKAEDAATAVDTAAAPAADATAGASEDAADASTEAKM